MGPRRQHLLVDLFGITVFGLGVKFYSGPGRDWINNAFGGVPYEVFWILLVAWLWPKLQPWRIAVGVLLVTCALEFAQLYQPDWLQTVRATLLGRLMLGNTFSWPDFPYYFVGAALGWGWLRWRR